MSSPARIFTAAILLAFVAYLLTLGWPWPRIVGLPAWLKAIGFTPWLDGLDPLSKWFAPSMTFLAVLVAVFQDKIRSWVRSPKLIAPFQLSAPYCCKIPVLITERMEFGGIQQRQLDAYQFRIPVQNAGDDRATFVEVHAVRLRDRNGSSLDWFLPMNLTWADDEKPFKEAISAKTQRLCNLGQIVKPESGALMGADPTQRPRTFDDANRVFLKIHTQVNASSWSNILFPGSYELDLEISASNAAPIQKTLFITFTGDWFDGWKEMFSPAGITIIDSDAAPQT